MYFKSYPLGTEISDAHYRLIVLFNIIIPISLHYLPIFLLKETVAQDFQLLYSIILLTVCRFM